MGYFLLVLAFFATILGLAKDVLSKKYTTWIAGAAVLTAALALGFGIAMIRADNLAISTASDERGVLQKSLDEMTKKSKALETQITEANAGAEAERQGLQNSLNEMTAKAARLEQQVRAGNASRQNSVTLQACNRLFAPIKELSDALYSVQTDSKYEAPNFNYQKFYHQNFRAFNSGIGDWNAFRALKRLGKGLLQGELLAIYNRKGADVAVKRRKEIAAEIKALGCSLVWGKRGFTVALTGN